MTEPMTSTVTTHPTLFGQVSLSAGIEMSNQTPTAVALTVTMAPARKQNISPFARLYAVTSVRPQIFSNWKYSVRRARVAIGAVSSSQLSTASRLPTARPPTTAAALTPEAMNSGPSMSSVPEVCSPAYCPRKLENPSHAFSGTGSRSYSSTGSFLREAVSSAMPVPSPWAEPNPRADVKARSSMGLPHLPADQRDAAGPAGAATSRIGPSRPAGTGTTLFMSCGSKRDP